MAARVASSSVAVVILAVVALVCSEPVENKNQFRLKRFSPSHSPFANLLQSRASLLNSGHLPTGGLGAELGRPKRAMFDDSCKGVYDRQLFSKLDRVCEDCYNLYRKASVSYECRTDCYGNPVFESCLYDLMLHDMVDKYAEMVQVVGKK